MVDKKRENHLSLERSTAAGDLPSTLNNHHSRSLRPSFLSTTSLLPCPSLPCSSSISFPHSVLLYSLPHSSLITHHSPLSSELLLHDGDELPISRGELIHSVFPATVPQPRRLRPPR